MFFDCVRTDTQLFSCFPVGILFEIAKAYNCPCRLAQSFHYGFSLAKLIFMFPILGLQVEHRCFPNTFGMIGFYLPVLEAVDCQMADCGKKL